MINIPEIWHTKQKQGNREMHILCTRSADAANEMMVAPRMAKVLEEFELWNSRSTADISDEARAELEPIFKQLEAVLTEMRKGAI